jgi:ankyrin repeat protein
MLTENDKNLFNLMRNFDYEGVRALLEEDQYVLDATNEQGKSPIMEAAFNNWAKMIALLLEFGADVHEEDEYRNTPLHQVSIGVDTDPVETARVLVGHGADVNARNSRGETPLHLVSSTAIELADYLLSQGADVNAKDAEGNTPLHRAAGLPSLKLAQLLVNHGADTNVRNLEGFSPADTAKWRKDYAPFKEVQRECEQLIKYLHSARRE